MKTLVFATATAFLSLGAGTASAATVAALTGDNTLTMVDTETKAATGTMDVSGVDGMLLGIDVRPKDGMLYGVFENGVVATIDPATGAATEVMTLQTMPPSSGVTVDFNPVADAIRIMGADGTNLRAPLKDTSGAVTADGDHAFADGDMHAGETANVVAGAYTNSMDGAEATALYNIDATIGGLLKQDPPNDGTLAAVGKLGVEVDEMVGFDIVSDGSGGNDAWMMSGGTLYEVNLETGAATEVAAIEGADGTVRDIAIMPAM